MFKDDGIVPPAWTIPLAQVGKLKIFRVGLFFPLRVEIVCAKMGDHSEKKNTFLKVTSSWIAASIYFDRCMPIKRRTLLIAPPPCYGSPSRDTGNNWRPWFMLMLIMLRLADTDTVRVSIHNTLFRVPSARKRIFDQKCRRERGRYSPTGKCTRAITRITASTRH